MDSVPDLRSLQVVESDQYSQAARLSALMAGTWLLLSVGAFAGAYSTAKLRPASIEIPLATMMGLMASACLIWACRLLVIDFYWKTDDRGLLARGFFRSRLFDWYQVAELTSVPSRYGLRVRVTAGRARLIIPASDFSGERVTASIMQHKGMHHAPAGDVHLSRLRSFWTPVPGRIPDDLDWQKSGSRLQMGWIVLALPLAAILVANVALRIRTTSAGELLFVLACVLAAAYGHWHMFIRPAFITAWRVTLRRDHIELRLARKSITWMWSQIGLAFFVDDQQLVLAKGLRGDAAIIPVNESSRDVVLAVIRRLRDSEPPHAMPIPDILLSRENGEAHPAG